MQRRVPTILQALPDMLQLLVILFFPGVVEFTFILNSQLAAVVMMVIGLVLFVLLTFTIAPLIYYHRNVELGGMFPCPYKSTLSRLLLRLTMAIRYRLYLMGHPLRYYLRYKLKWRLFGRRVSYRCWLSRSPFFDKQSWLDLDRETLFPMETPDWNQSHLYLSIQDAKNLLGFNPTVASHIFHCVTDPELDIPDRILDTEGSRGSCDIHPNNERRRVPHSLIILDMLGAGLALDDRLRAEVTCAFRVDRSVSSVPSIHHSGRALLD